MELTLSMSRSADADLDPRTSKFAKEDISSIPDYNIHNAEGIFKIPCKGGYVIFDNERGMGNTPNGRNILYRGCVAIMDMDKLIDCLPSMRAREQAGFQMIDYIKQGYGIASPLIDVEIDPYVDQESGVARFVGHEGRARLWAMQKLGVKEVPVQLQFVGYRARAVTNKEEFERWMQDGVKLEKSNRIVKHLFKDIQFG